MQKSQRNIGFSIILMCFKDILSQFVNNCTFSYKGNTSMFVTKRRWAAEQYKMDTTGNFG